MSEVEVKKTIIDEVKCNLCGSSIPHTPGYPGQFEFAILRSDWGYGSNHDGDAFDLHFCEQCVYERLLPLMLIQPDVRSSF